MLDGDCPNVNSHRTAGDNFQHPISAHEFTQQVSEQLRRNPYEKCDAPDRQQEGIRLRALCTGDVVPLYSIWRSFR